MDAIGDFSDDGTRVSRYLLTFCFRWMFSFNHSMCIKIISTRIKFSTILHFQKMEYSIIQGVREGSHLVYVAEQKLLYVFKVERNGRKTYICYQTIICARKNDQNHDHTRCTARIVLLDDRYCEASSSHSAHVDHEIIFEDLRKRNNMKIKCHFLKEEFAEDAHKISARTIFQKEIAK